MINKSVFEGRVTKDPELKTVGEKRVVNTTIAVPRTKKDEADFIPVVIWGKQAESFAKYMSKGSLVSVEGRLSSRTYESSTGEKRFVLEIVAYKVNFLSSGKKNSSVSEKIETKSQNQEQGQAVENESTYSQEINEYYKTLYNQYEGLYDVSGSGVTMN